MIDQIFERTINANQEIMENRSSINVKELRIGNYIEYATIRCKVEAINLDDFIMTDGCEAPIEAFNPIPLTEEWLLKFGFEYREDTGFNGWYSTPILGESIRIFEIENKWFKYHSSHTVIKFVHQLQNLYFALTSEELILN